MHAVNAAGLFFGQICAYERMRAQQTFKRRDKNESRQRQRKNPAGGSRELW